MLTYANLCSGETVPHNKTLHIFTPHFAFPDIQYYKLHRQILHSNIILCTGILHCIALHCDIAAILDLHLSRPVLHLILLQQDKSPPARLSITFIWYYYLHFHTFHSLSYLWDSDGKDGGYNNIYRSPFQELLLILIRLIRLPEIYQIF